MLYIENILSLQVKNTDRKIGFIFGAGNRGRTDTMLPSRDFKSLASACSAIPAQIYRNSISRAKTFVNCRRGLKNKIKNKKSLQSRTLLLEAPPRLELGSRGFADLCLTTWLWRLYCRIFVLSLLRYGAGDGIRTRDICLGKATLYH